MSNPREAHLPYGCGAAWGRGQGGARRPSWHEPKNHRPSPSSHACGSQRLSLRRLVPPTVRHRLGITGEGGRRGRPRTVSKRAEHVPAWQPYRDKPQPRRCRPEAQELQPLRQKIPPPLLFATLGLHQPSGPGVRTKAIRPLSGRAAAAKASSASHGSLCSPGSLSIVAAPRLSPRRRRLQRLRLETMEPCRAFPPECLFPAPVAITELLF